MKSADVNDNASEVEDTFREEAIKAVQESLKPPRWWDGISCTMCEEEIEPGRLKLGLFTCLVCQAEKERLGKLYRSHP